MESKAVTKREDAENAAAMWSEVGEQALQAWIAAYMNHRAAWLRLTAAWKKTARLRALKTTVPAGIVPSVDEMHLPFFAAASKSDVPSDDEKPRRRIVPRAYAVAASLVLSVLAAGAMSFLSAGPSYHTGIGAVQTIPLSDGSRVTLNTQTKIRVDVTAGERRIRLERGEAYFDVANDPLRPFIVEANDKRIVAVGTQFSVRCDAQDVRVVVTEGAVRLIAPPNGSSGQPSAGAPESGVLLTAGAVARAGEESVLVRQTAAAEIEQALSWRTGYLVFDRTPLADAVAEFNRYNARQVRIDDPELTAIPVGGSFRASNVDAFLRLIERELPLRTVENDREVVIEGKVHPEK
jgi:transmembrane sensor